MSNSRDIADSAATINYIDGLTSDAQTQIDTKAVYPTQAGNAGKYLSTDGTNASWGEVQASPTHQATASGAISDGDKIIVNSDGTVSTIVQTIDSTTPSIGDSEIFYPNVQTIGSTPVYDTNSNKLVVFYARANKVQAVVATITDGVISYGSEVQVSTANVFSNYLNAAFSTTDNVFCVVFNNSATNGATAVICEVNGDTLTIGSEAALGTTQHNYDVGPAVVYDANTDSFCAFVTDTSNSGYGTLRQIFITTGLNFNYGNAVVFSSVNSARQIAASVDTTSNKVLVAYQKNNVGRGACKVCTPSNSTAINAAFGSEVDFNGSSNAELIVCVYDSNANKSVIYFWDASNQYPTAIVGTISGTSVSFGTKVVIQSTRTNFNAAAFDSDQNKIAFIYSDSFDGYYGKMSVGTVNGTTIDSITTPITFESKNVQQQRATYDPDSQTVPVAYFYNEAVDDGVTTLLRTYTPETTLTSSNYIGIADASYIDGETVNVQISGSVDDAQTGLTAGITYYVTGNNGLSTVPQNPSVVAGTAVSSTQIIVKG